MEVKYYHRDIERFLNSLDKTTRARVDRSIQLLSQRTYQLMMPDSKRLEKDLYELRIRSLESIRIFYTFFESQIILLYAIHKKSQELKLKDLSTARQRLNFLHFQ
jgi:phage-related protein